jgi:hypothetical protein
MDRGWHRGQLGKIVAHDHLRLAALTEQPIEFASNPDPRDRGVGDQRQTLAGAIAHTPATSEPVSSEVH